jgi:hypothetical protein
VTENGDNDTHNMQSSETTQIVSSESITFAVETPSQPHGKTYKDIKMPNPFYETDGGGSLSSMRFSSMTFNDISDGKLDFIQYIYVMPFVEDMVNFHNWSKNLHNRMFENEPSTSLMSYPNLYSFFVDFDVPVEELKPIMKKDQLYMIDMLGENLTERDYFSDYEIDLICSLDEQAIMEHFVSDYSIYNDGEIFTPMWLYYHDTEEYEEVGLTLEMIDEKLEFYAELDFTEEAEEAFSEKLSEFLDEEVSLKEIRRHGWRRRGG